jgi:hypothetical protein
MNSLGMTKEELSKVKGGTASAKGPGNTVGM